MYDPMLTTERPPGTNRLESRLVAAHLPRRRNTEARPLASGQNQSTNNNENMTLNRSKTVPMAQKPSASHDSSPPSMPSQTKQQENLLQEHLMQALMYQVQAMQVLFQDQDEQLQFLRKIQNLIDDWTDAREAQLAWGEYELTGVEGTLSYGEYREKHRGA